MILWGAANLWQGTVHLNPVLIVFGLLGSFAAGGDMKAFLRPPQNKNAWYFDHMSGMIASYIAAVSAFAVVNLTFLPPLVRWLGPTAIGVPLLLLWIRSYQNKFKQGKKPEEVAIVREYVRANEAA